MKSIFCTLLICVFIIESFGQKTEKSTIIKEVQARIYLDEKANKPLKVLPDLLLRAFCDGRLKAYYPNRTNVQMSYYDFLWYFGIHEPVANVNELLPCPSANCLQLDPVFTDAFSVAFDFSEIQRLDKATSQYIYDVQYVRMVFPPSYSGAGQEYFGPVFHYEDIVKIFPYAIFFNRQNDAAKFTLKQLFSTRNFNAIIFPEKDMFGRLQKNEEVVEKERRDVWEE
jgi:hypothetical protein